jgi:hypothetical protein
MSKTIAWMAKSLLVSLILGLATYAILYGFLTIHQETGLRPDFSYKPALVVFFISAIACAIYFRSRAEP